MGVERHHLHLSQPRRRQRGHPCPELAGISTFEHVEQLAGDHIDHGADEAPTAPIRARPVRSNADHNVDHDTPKPSGDRARGAFQGSHSVGGPFAGSGGEHPAWLSEGRLLGPGAHLAVVVATLPDAPAQAHRPVAARCVAQRHPSQLLREGLQRSFIDGNRKSYICPKTVQLH